MNEPVEVEVAGQTIELHAPRALWERRKIVMAYNASVSTDMRAEIMAAALVLCWPEPRRKPGVPAFVYGMALHAYGAVVLEYLLTLGIDRPDYDMVAREAEIAKAGAAAYNLVKRSIPTKRQEDEARGNSEAPSGG